MQVDVFNKVRVSFPFDDTLTPQEGVVIQKTSGIRMLNQTPTCEVLSIRVRFPASEDQTFHYGLNGKWYPFDEEAEEPLLYDDTDSVTIEVL